MKNLFKLTRLWVASLLLLFGFTTNAWADKGFDDSNNGVNFWKVLAGQQQGADDSWYHGRTWSGRDLGTVTSLYLKSYKCQLYQNWDEKDNIWGNGWLYFNVHRTAEKAGSFTKKEKQQWNWNDWSDGWRHPTFSDNGDMSVNLLSNLASGKYTFEYYFKANGNSDMFCNNGDGSNFHITFTYNPIPAVTGFSSSVSANLSGDGQSSSPYIIKYGTDVTLTLSADNSSDANSHLQIKVGESGSWSDNLTTTINSTSTSNNNSVKIYYRYCNTGDDLHGEEGSTTIYYRSASYNVTLNANGGTIADGKDITSYNYGVGATLPTAPDEVSQAGYDFDGWFLNNTGDAVTAIGADESGIKSFTAHWTQNIQYYKVTLNIGENGSLTSVKDNNGKNVDVDNVVGGTTIIVTVTPESGYEVDTWTCGEDSQIGEDTYTTTISAPTEIGVTFKETKYAVTIQTSIGISSVTPPGEQQVGNVNPVEISATVATGYTWSQWTSSNANVTIANPSLSSTTIKATGEGSVTANATENMTAVTVSSNNTTWGTVNVNNASVGVTTTQQLVATNKYGYKFKEWILQGGAQLAAGSSLNTATITIKGDGNGTAGTAQAIFEEDLSTDWQLNFSHEGWHLYDFVKETGQSTGTIAYYSIDLEIDKSYEFEIRKKSSNTYYKNTGTMTATNCTDWSFTTSADKKAWLNTSVAGTYKFKIDFSGSNPVISVIYPDITCIQGDFDGWSRTAHTINEANNWTTTVNITDDNANKTLKFRLVWHGAYYSNTGTMTSENCTGWTFEKELSRNYCEIKTTVAGNYTFSLNTSDKKLSVTYPGEEHHTVIVDNGESTKEVDVKEVTETEISAPQYLNGMRFYRWVVTNADNVDKSSSITINHPENFSTHMHGAKENGLIVRATYTTQGIVYLNKQYIKNNWPGDVYVYFYKGAYWDDTKDELGSGSKTSANCISDGKKMTRVSDKSDIYYYDYSGDILSGRDSHIAFLDQREDNYDNFYACQAIYRGDFQECSPMFVPRDWKYYYNKRDGQAVYYQEGYWRTYGSTEAGLSLVFWKGGNKTTIPFTADNANSNTFKAIVNITDATGNDSYFKLRCCGGDEGNQDYWYGCKTNMSATSCTNYRFYSGSNTENENCGIGLTSTGDYVFILSLADGQVFVSVEYPLSNGDYRLVSVTDGKVHDNGMFYKSSTDRVDTASFFITNAHTSLVKLQKCTDATSVPAKWEDVDGKSINTSAYTTGIYNFTFTQSGESSKEIAKLDEYTGDFYIRTAIAAGGWDAYKGSADNLLPYIEYGLDESQPFKFTHAYTNWVEKDKNVKFCIANDYSLCVSDTLVGDDILGKEVNADWLKNGANIRFMWNKNTNALSRAYISGSTNDEEKYLMLINTNKKMYNIPAESETPVQIDELKFTDKNNWVYQADIKAEPGCAVKLTAQYTIGSEKHVQYFMGSESTTRTIISGSATDKQYTMRVVYDFKTNRLTAGWVPDGQEITDNIKLGGDMLITRTHQEDAQQIIFGAGGSIEQIHHVYGVLTLQKDVMAGTEGNSYSDKATNANYEKTMYWISFPFDVNISEIFGVDGYGKKWIMQKYNGQRRADIGWFAETSTFWEYMDISEKLNAYEGYLFIVDANYFNTLDADVWKNSATEANFYFPSASGNIGIINKSSYPQIVPDHECKITRTFEVDGKILSHTVTDSHWNVIGVPAFQNASGSVAPKDNNFKAFYEWDSETNSYDVRTTADSYEFKTMYAYMTQFYGTINWTDVSVVSKVPYAYADDKNYMIELFFNGNGAEDHTYVKLADGAHTDFELNEDMMKIDNAGQPNIYSFAGAYDVAYNETTMDNQSVMLGVSAPKDGSYTFAMPKDFSGKAVLVDLESGEATDLNLSNYTVELNKGTYNNRFQLLLEVEAKAPTNMNPTKGEWSVDGKTKKLFINSNIYLINAGRIYNVLGVGE